MSCSVQRTHCNGCFQWYSVMWTKRVKLVEVKLVFDYTCLHGFKVRDHLTSQNKPVTRRKLKQEILLEQVMIIIHQQHNEIALKYVISFPFLEKKRKGKKTSAAVGRVYLDATCARRCENILLFNHSFCNLHKTLFHSTTHFVLYPPGRYCIRAWVVEQFQSNRVEITCMQSEVTF